MVKYWSNIIADDCSLINVMKYREGREVEHLCEELFRHISVVVTMYHRYYVTMYLWFPFVALRQRHYFRLIPE